MSKPKIVPCGLFYTPKTSDELMARLENFSGGEKAAAMMGYGLTWNFLAAATAEDGPAVPDEERTLAGLRREIAFWNVSDLIPLDWSDWFWELLSENAPFAWGPNQVSLVRAHRLVSHMRTVCEMPIEEGIILQTDLDDVITLIENLGENALINMEG
jgi:hypothetical protein